MSAKISSKRFFYQCLNKDPTQRLGAENTGDIKNHPWFKNIDWTAVLEKKIDPPIKPVIEDKFDTTNFHRDLAKESNLIRGKVLKSERTRTSDSQQQRRKIQRLLAYQLIRFSSILALLIDYTRSL